MPQQVKNPFLHQHDHHDHDHDHDHHHHGDGQYVEELDPAQQSLSDALRVSFFVLKVVMLLLFVAYLFSGIFQVPEQERAVRLRFGKIVGAPGEQVYAPGWHLGFPYPVEQVIKVPVNQRTVRIDSAFWYEQDGLQAGRGPLNPERDGSLLTGDANIVHTRWQVTYHIEDPADFVRNVGRLDLADELVQAAAEQAIVHQVAITEADAVIRDQINDTQAAARAQEVLNEALATGIEIDALALVDSEMPVSVRDAYQAVVNAESDRAQRIEQAQQERARMLGETAGEAHDELFALVQAYAIAREALRPELVARLDHHLDQSLRALQVPRTADGHSYTLVRRLLETYLSHEAAERPEAAAETVAQLEALLDELDRIISDFVRIRELRYVSLPLDSVPMSVRDQFTAVLTADAPAAALEALAQEEAASPDSARIELDALAEALHTALVAGDRALADRLMAQLEQVLLQRRVPQPEGEPAYPTVVTLVRQAVSDEAGQAEAARAALDERLAALEALQAQFAWAQQREPELLLVSVGGQVAERISEARTYSTAVVEQVKAEAATFQALVEEYRRSPMLLMTRLWADAKEQILTGEVETFYTMPGQLYTVLNRDPEIQRKREEQRLREEEQRRREEARRNRGG